jgi:hypothetical protein
MKKITNGIVTNPKGVIINADNGDELHYGHTLNIVSQHKFTQGGKGWIVEPHGYDYPVTLSEKDVTVYLGH